LKDLYQSSPAKNKKTKKQKKELYLDPFYAPLNAIIALKKLHFFLVDFS